MKQSTKLLSLVLALLLAFSSLSVIGNAVLVRSEVSWDNIDDAALTYNRVIFHQKKLIFAENITLFGYVGF